MKLKDDKGCQCTGRDREQDRGRKPCRFGYCTLVLCSRCGLPWCEWGPIDCPHKKKSGNGTLRWYKYPDMDVKPHVAVKRRRKKKRDAAHGL